MVFRRLVELQETPACTGTMDMDMVGPDLLYIGVILKSWALALTIFPRLDRAFHYCLRISDTYIVHKF